MYGWAIVFSAASMFVAQPRSGPTAIGRTNWERTRSSFTTRKTGKGQSAQCFRKKKANGRQVSKNASQLETTMATELANAFSSGIRNRCGSRIHHARDFFRRSAGSLAMWPRFEYSTLLQK